MAEKSIKSKSSKRTTRRKTPLSTEEVLKAAVRLADDIGLEAFSMRTLAEALNVKVMSLYNHISSKEHVLDGMVELVVSEIDLPSQGHDWRSAMRQRARSAHAVLMKHPWATMLFVSRLHIGPNMLRYVDATIGCLRSAGFSYPMADHAWTALDAFVYGFTLQKLNFPLNPGDYAPAAEKFLPLIPVEHFPYLNGMSQEVIAGRHDGLHHLDLGLELLLDGLERMRSATSSPTQG